MAKPRHLILAPVSRGRKLARRSFLRGAVGLAVGASLGGSGRGLAAAGGGGKLELGKLRPYWNEIPDNSILESRDPAIDPGAGRQSVRLASSALKFRLLVML